LDFEQSSPEDKLQHHLLTVLMFSPKDLGQGTHLNDQFQTELSN
jgi:hypothetical protein